MVPSPWAEVGQLQKHTKRVVDTLPGRSVCSYVTVAIDLNGARGEGLRGHAVESPLAPRSARINVL